MIRLYEVGGCVRDVILGLKPHDWDYSVEISGVNPLSVGEAFDAMELYLEAFDFEIFVENPEHGTIRARFPRGDRDKNLKARTADFVLCRKDGPSSDGRRPDYVEVGTLEDDLNRRDFTVNALAVPVNVAGEQAGNVIDLHNGVWDLSIRRLRFVGDPMDRLREDGLRILRALRFKITKDFEFDQSIRDVLQEPEVAELLAGTSVERRREELERCFHHDTLATVDLIAHDISVELREALFSGSLRLSATQRRDFVHAQTHKG